MDIDRAVVNREEVLHMPHTVLKIHPRNMRQVYPQHEVERMASSIKERGVIEPLIGTRVNGHVQIVVGNLRLMSARHLGSAAPLMPVIVREKEEAEQYLDMVAENLVRAAPDPISEALHYRRILQEPGMSIARLSRETGIASNTINDRLRLLELEPEIRDLVAAGRFPRGRESVEALLSIPDVGARVETARALAERRADVRLIKATCTRVRGRLERRSKVQRAARKGREYVPALEAAKEESLPPEKEKKVPWKALEEASVSACGNCVVGTEELIRIIRPAWQLFQEKEGPVALSGNGPDPTWGEVAQAAEGTCVACGLRDVERLCGACPLIQFLQRVVRQVNRRG
jgi:ParB family chromosome partitioning protein